MSNVLDIVRSNMGNCVDTPVDTVIMYERVLKVSGRIVKYVAIKRSMEWVVASSFKETPRFSEYEFFNMLKNDDCIVSVKVMVPLEEVKVPF